jgi:hypothetical protein
MSDLEKFIELYANFGISFNKQENDNVITLYLGEHDFAYFSKKITGYYGFYSTIDFTKDGEFIKQGFWE